MDLFSTSSANQHSWLTLPDSQLLWLPNFLSQQESDQLFSCLKQCVPWKQETIRLFGRSVLQPRLQAWYGSHPYTYSGLTVNPLPWIEPLHDIKQRCEELAGCPFNSVLANMYRDGQDSMGSHQDNEPELGKNPVIASVSLGETRRFTLRHQLSGEKHTMELEHGSLLIMAGATQHFWKHSVPKTRRPCSERINLTYRYVYDQK